MAMLLCGTILVLALAQPAPAQQPEDPVVLVLIKDGLTWESAARTPGLAPVFRDGATASLSTAQGRASDDPRIGYALLGAGARADTTLLPDELPKQRAKVPDAFDGPAATIQPGSLGDTLAKSGVQPAAIGESAALVVMDSKGRVPTVYETDDPSKKLEKATQSGAGFVAVEASNPRESSEIVETAWEAGAAVAVAAPNAPAGAANLTPFALSGSDGVLYSPGTRTNGLLSSEDVAPTLLNRLGIKAPPEMAGRAAEIRPGSTPDAARLQERLAFVDEERAVVWALLVGTSAAAVVLGTVLRGRDGVRMAVLFLVALPFGTLAAAAVPIIDAVLVAVLAAVLAGGLVVLALGFSSGKLGGLAVVSLVTVVAVLADAAFGGEVMGFSVLGHDPAYGTRFYGIGNEYSAVVAGALPLGAGLAVGLRPRLIALVPVVGVAAMVALGLPPMGADVGGSLALGFGLGATMGLLRGGRPLSIALWSGGGLFVAVVLFVVGGSLFPDVSHGARAASGDVALYEVAARKIILSLRHLLNPIWTVLLMALAALTFFGWRRVRGEVGGRAVAAGMLGAAVAAAASGALNDSGILAAILALAYPAAAGLMVLIQPRNPSTSDI